MSRVCNESRRSKMHHGVRALCALPLLAPSPDSRNQVQPVSNSARHRMRKQGERGGAELRLALSYKQYLTVRTRERPPVCVPCAMYVNRLTSANLGLDPAETSVTSFTEINCSPDQTEQVASTKGITKILSCVTRSACLQRSSVLVLRPPLGCAHGCGLA